MTINIGTSRSDNSMPPVVEVTIPGGIEVHVGSIGSSGKVRVGFVVSSVHEIVKLIAAVEVAASLTWALFNFITGLSHWVPLVCGVSAAVARIREGGLVAASWTSVGRRIVVIITSFAAVSISVSSGVIQPHEERISHVGDGCAALFLVSEAFLGVFAPVVLTAFSLVVASIILRKFALGQRIRAAEGLVDALFEDLAPRLIIWATVFSGGVIAIVGVLTPFLIRFTAVIGDGDTFFKDFAP